MSGNSGSVANNSVLNYSKFGRGTDAEYQRDACGTNDEQRTFDPPAQYKDNVL